MTRKLIELAEPAISAAIRHFEGIEAEYRNPRGEKAKRMSKSVRQGLAAQYAGWVRDLAALRARHD